MSTQNILTPNNKRKMSENIESSTSPSASATATAEQQNLINLNKFSRQNAALGAETTAKLSKMKVLVYGLQGLGVEVAKNLALQGVGALTLVDETPTKITDAGLNFFLNESDVGKLRSACVVPRLQELNNICRMTTATSLSPEVVSEHSVVAITQPLRLAELISLNEFCRTRNIGFIYGFSASVFGHIFTDFGANHRVSDKDGEKPLQKIITDITRCTDNADQILIRYSTPEGSLQTQLSGGFVEISEVKGIQGIEGLHQIVTNFNDPNRSIRISYPESSPLDGYVAGTGMILEKKVTLDHPMKSLTEKIKSPGDTFGDPATLVNTDLIHFGIEYQHHISFVAFHTFIDRYGRYPTPYDESDAQLMLAIAKELISSKQIDIDNEVDDNSILRYARLAAIELQPMSAFLGGVMAQEVVKFTGKLTPIPGFLHWATTESLPTQTPSEAERAPRGSRLDNLASIYGWSFVDQLGDLNYFMVGCGALGCEFLKNFALNGICCGPKGLLSVTDPDRIELSNLTRQFLFREHNVGQPKSKAGAAMAKKMNEGFKINSLELLAGTKSEDYFNDNFWMKLDGVCNALDNMEARFYIDAQCVKYKKSLLESGTMGTGGNVDTVVPFKTRTYADGGQSAEGGGVPMCTLRNFPHITDHCIEWARDQFELLFKKLSKNCENYLSDPEGYEIETLSKAEIGMSIFDTRSMISFFKAARDRSMESCVSCAFDLFHFLFRDRIKDLQNQFPRDSRLIGEDGSDKGPFWGEKKRYPTAAAFNSQDEAHINFLVSTTILLAVNLGLIPQRVEGDPAYATSPEPILQMASLLKEVEYVPSPVSGIDVKNQMDLDAKPGEKELRELFSVLREVSSSTNLGKVDIQDFEKDDDLNFHILFMTSCANLRCDNYQIKRTNFHECKVIAGRIIPALATTTTAVCGLVMFELFKIRMGCDTEAYMSRLIGLGGNAYTSFSQDQPNKFSRYVREEDPSKDVLEELGASAYDDKGLIKSEHKVRTPMRAYPEGHSCWDTIKCSGSLTIKQFAEWFERDHGLRLNSWNFIYGKTNTGSAISAKVFPPEEVLDPSLLPPLDISQNDMVRAIMANKAIVYKQKYQKLWRDLKAAGTATLAPRNDVITENTTLKEVFNILEAMGEAAMTRKELVEKYISNTASRRFILLNKHTGLPDCSDIQSGEEIEHLCNIEIDME